MLRFPRRAVARFVALLRSDLAGVRAGFFALLISSGGDLVTGLTLASITGTLDRAARPLHPDPGRDRHARQHLRRARQPPRHADPRRDVPRVAPHRHAVRPERRRRDRARRSRSRPCSRCSPRSCRGAFASGRRSRSSTSWSISVIGAIISSIVVLVITVAVAAFCARRSLDLDNVAAPIVTAAGDIATLPSLFLATYLVGFRFVTPVDRGRCARRSRVGSLVVALARRSCRSCAASCSSRSRSSCSRASSTCSPASRSRSASSRSSRSRRCSCSCPPSSRTPGSLGAILAARISTKLHLGTLEPGRGAWRAAADDVMLIYVYAMPVFVFLGLSSIIVAHVARQGEPGRARHDGRGAARRASWPRPRS